MGQYLSNQAGDMGKQEITVIEDGLDDLIEEARAYYIARVCDKGETYTSMKAPHHVKNIRSYNRKDLALVDKIRQLVIGQEYKVESEYWVMEFDQYRLRGQENFIKYDHWSTPYAVDMVTAIFCFKTGEISGGDLEIRKDCKTQSVAVKNKSIVIHTSRSLHKMTPVSGFGTRANLTLIFYSNK